MQSLGFGLREVGLSGKALALLFALEVQYLVDNDMADELPELEESYDIPEQRAGDIVEAVAIRYIDQLLNVALLAAQKYEEAECIAKVKEILKYADFVSRPVRANARIFSEEDKKRLISFYLTELESALDEGEEAVGDVAAKKDHEIQLLKDLIDLSEDYVTPGNGMRGLLGTMPEDTVGNDATKGKKNWAWG
ncbi:hypothetical protein EON65_10845 [archaeon]|nr:MAG: hypothetical protein EON65_10845 [archaeon]